VKDVREGRTSEGEKRGRYLAETIRACAIRDLADEGLIVIELLSQRPLEQLTSEYP
jgi:hypothetical protein